MSSRDISFQASETGNSARPFLWGAGPGSPGCQEIPAFGPDAYRRLAAANTNPLAAPDADSPYQDDGPCRITQATLAGDGSSENGGSGLGTYTYSNTASGNPAGYNSRQSGCQETTAPWVWASWPTRSCG